MRDIDWTYSVAFKQPKSNKLRWVLTTSQDVTEASHQAADFRAKRKWSGTWLEYGHSRTEKP